MMKTVFPALALAAAALLTCASSASASVYVIDPVDLGDGYTLSGSILTDSTFGAVGAANIREWNIKVTAVSDLIFTPANTGNISHGVTSDGAQLHVATSPDGIEDGGLLGFSGGHRNNALVADFTGFNAAGGLASYAKGAASDALPLGVANGADYVAATSAGGGVFDLTPLTFSPGLVMSGTIITDGGLGAANITDWFIRVRETLTWTFTGANSRVLADFGLTADRTGLRVTPDDGSGGAGSFIIGAFNGFDLTGVLLGDFGSDPAGQVGFASPFTLQMITPPLEADGRYLVARAVAVPEPASWTLLIAGFGGAGAVLRGARRRAAPQA